MAGISKNTRKHKRIKRSFLLKFQQAKFPSLVNMQDISEGGLSFLTKEEVQEGDEIEMSILVPSFEFPVNVKAIVKRVTASRRKTLPYLVGVKFGKMSAPDRRALNGFQKLLKEEKKVPFFIDIPNFFIRKKT